MKNLGQCPHQIISNEHPLSLYEFFWTQKRVLISRFPTFSPLNTAKSLICKGQQKAKSITVRKETSRSQQKALPAYSPHSMNWTYLQIQKIERKPELKKVSNKSHKFQEQHRTEQISKVIMFHPLPKHVLDRYFWTHQPSLYSQ